MSYKDNVGIEERRTRIAALMVTMARPTVRRICEALATMPNPIDVTKSTVDRDMRAIRDEWREARLGDIDQLVERELAEIDQVKQEAWREFSKSRRQFERRTDKLSRPVGENGVPDPHAPQTVVESWETREQREGNPKYLEILLKCSEARARLLGINQNAGIPGTIVGQSVTITLDLGESRTPTQVEVSDEDLEAEWEVDHRESAEAFGSGSQ